MAEILPHTAHITEAVPHFAPLPTGVGGGRMRLVVSAGAHALLLAALLFGSHSARVRPVRLPGTRDGVRLLTYYSPNGGTPTQAAASKTVAKPKPTPAAELTSPVAPDIAKAASPDPGKTADAGASGQGDGQIKIAAVRFSPHPEPSLTSMKPGSQGDVVLDAVIDTDGHIKDLTVTTSISPVIDEAVEATVRQWVFAPATRNGVPVVSEQELYFHYGRG